MLGFTVPVCFRPMSTMTNKDMDIIDQFLYTKWDNNPYPLGYVEKDGDEWYAVDENNIDRNVLHTMKHIIGDGLRSLGFTIIESKEVPYAIAMEYELEPMVKTADLRDKIRTKSPLVGLPIRPVFMNKPGPAGIITEANSEKVVFKGDDIIQGDVRYYRDTDISERSGRVYTCSHNDRARYTGSYIVYLDDKNLGAIEDIQDGFIETKTKKIDSYNWGMQIDNRARIIRMSK